MVRISPNISIPEKQLADFCQRHHIRKLSLFGSILSDRFGPESDVDVLVEFETGHTPGLSLIRMQDELSTLFGGRKIDLVTPKFLNKRIRDKVVAVAAVQYAQR
ncbi:MAG: nucleotidyltransferase family protein [Anaerolineaceae bacterium]|nr:nucleotidyltransferase family protein [Anaerolineaceae bacterium]